MPIITESNSDWGICGFSQTLAALQQQNPVVRARITFAASRHELDTRMLAEIKTTLMLLKATGKATILNNITRFTRSFGGVYSAWNVETYIQRINAITAIPHSGDQGLGKGSTRRRAIDAGIAIPPDALIYILQEIYDIRNARLIDKTSKRGHVIIGLGKGRAEGPYEGLKHWIYKIDSKRCWNWGKQKSERAVLKECAVQCGGIVYKIATQ